jgi:hypothetical protein
VALAASALASWLFTVPKLGGVGALPHPVGLARVLPLDALAHPAGLGLVAAAQALLAVAFALRWREDLASVGLWAIVGLSATMEMSVRDIFMPHLETMLAGGLLSAWMVGRASARRMGLDSGASDAWAHDMVVGTFGAMMTLAATSKLAASGLAWTDGPTHCAIVYEHALLGPPGPLTAFRGWLANHPALCASGATGILGAELVGFCVVWPGARRAYAWVTVGVFVALAGALAIFEVSWAVLALALAYSTLGDPEPSPRAGPGEPAVGGLGSGDAG